MFWECWHHMKYLLLLCSDIKSWTHIWNSGCCYCSGIMYVCNEDSGIWCHNVFFSNCSFSVEESSKGSFKCNLRHHQGMHSYQNPVCPTPKHLKKPCKTTYWFYQKHTAFIKNTHLLKKRQRQRRTPSHLTHFAKSGTISTTKYTQRQRRSFEGNYNCFLCNSLAKSDTTILCRAQN